MEQCIVLFFQSFPNQLKQFPYNPTKTAQVMGVNSTNARMLERIWFFVAGAGEQRTDNLLQWYASSHGDTPRLANMTQSLISSGLFKRVGWYDRIDDVMMRTNQSSRDLGLNSARYICVVDVKSLDEIIDKYINNKSTLRTLSSMPSFVKDAVKEASQ